MNLPKKLHNRFTLRAQHIIDTLTENTSLSELFKKLYESQGSFASNFLQLEGIKGEHLAFFSGQERGTKEYLIGLCLQEAARVAFEAGHFLIGTQHLLYGLLLLYGQDESLRAFFRHIGRSSHRLKTILESIIINDLMMGSPAQWEESQFPHRHNEDLHRISHREQRAAPALKGLGNFLQDLVDKARQGHLDPLIGRQRELDRIIQILNRRTKRNPVLVGDPGVGKTAIVYGLAQKITKGEVPPSLKGKCIFALNLSSLVAGTMFRGDFEARIEAVLKEVRLTRAILFIDEIHNVVGAGSATGTLDAANILKPALAEGEVQVIGSTTYEEYKFYIENDKALERRFQPVFIGEPSLAEAVEILKGLRERYETFHGIKIHPRAIEAAVKLSRRYIQERFLPDKALDVLDEASAQASIAKGLRQEMRKIEFLKTKASLLKHQKEEKLHQGFYETAFALKRQEELILRKASLLEESFCRNLKPVMVSERDVKRVITTMTGIPFQEISSDDNKHLEHLERELGQEVVGQEEAIRLLANSIRRSRAGLSSHQRPLGSFIFIGPSGVGKTELARVLAKKLYGQNSFIKLDMSEFVEPHSISRLIGAPAGYVGYGKGGELTEKVRHNPYSLILFDEVEKAHPHLFNILLQILEDGRLSDATGLEVDFKNAIIILTSNLGGEKLFEKKMEIGFGQTKEKAIDYEDIRNQAMVALQAYLRPELLNRIDNVIVFHPLGFKHIKEITAIQLRNLVLYLKEEKTITINYTSSLVDWLAKKAFEVRKGARLVRRTIEREISDPLAAKIISGEIKAKKIIRISCKRGALCIQ